MACVWTVQGSQGSCVLYVCGARPSRSQWLGVQTFSRQNTRMPVACQFGEQAPDSRSRVLAVVRWLRLQIYTPYRSQAAYALTLSAGPPKCVQYTAVGPGADTHGQHVYACQASFSPSLQAAVLVGCCAPSVLCRCRCKSRTPCTEGG